MHKAIDFHKGDVVYYVKYVNRQYSIRQATIYSNSIDNHYVSCNYKDQFIRKYSNEIFSDKRSAIIQLIKPSKASIKIMNKYINIYKEKIKEANIFKRFISSTITIFQKELYAIN